MGDWYEVIKTIKGRRYRYRQRTWREGGKVRTESHSLGPIEPASLEPTAKPARRLRSLTTRMLAALQNEQAASDAWVKPWDLRRNAASEVKPVPAIDALIKARAPKLRSARIGAVYRPITDQIVLPPRACFVSDGATSATQTYYATLLHELAHWTGHKTRCDRFARSGSMKDLGNRAREELIAEATALIVLDAVGERPADLRHHCRYFQYWLSLTGDKAEALAFVQEEAEAAARFILDGTR